MDIKNLQIIDGEFENNSFSGKGKYTYQNGDIYEGQFVNNLKNGHGKYSY